MNCKRPIIIVGKWSHRDTIAVVQGTVTTHKAAVPKRRVLRIVNGPVPIRQGHGRIDPLQGNLEAEKKLAMPGQEAGPKVGGRRLLLEGLAVVGDELVVALLAFDPL